MERAIAVKKLGKIIGKGFGYRINDKAPTPEERETARAELPSATDAATKLRQQWEARREVILAADAEYQQLYSSWKAARYQVEKLRGKLCHFKFTVGKSVGIAGFPMFSVEAEGDTWEEVIAKLDRKKAA